jgi:hypothetical protein
LVAKGYLVRVLSAAGRRRYLPAERAGDAGRSMTVEQVAERVREVDGRTPALGSAMMVINCPGSGRGAKVEVRHG